MTKFSYLTLAEKLCIERVVDGADVMSFTLATKGNYNEN